VTRVTLVDAGGHVFSAKTAAAPNGYVDAFRLWALALPSSQATRIKAYDAHDKLLMSKPFYPSSDLRLY
jgi:hypothetical protein